MSDYERQKVIRYPLPKEVWEHYGIKDIYDLENKPNKQYWDRRADRYFQIAPTTKYFLDYVIKSDYGADCGEWGKIRKLNLSEQKRFAPLFEKVLEDFINTNKLRLVEYCWYNCSEAPDYYDIKDDSFYEEVF